MRIIATPHTRMYSRISATGTHYSRCAYAYLTHVRSRTNACSVPTRTDAKSCACILVCTAIHTHTNNTHTNNTHTNNTHQMKLQMQSQLDLNHSEYEKDKTNLTHQYGVERKEFVGHLESAEGTVCARA